MGFDQKTRTKILLWSDRHCCLCKKACGINIEVHHLLPKSKGGGDDIDNAIPLCFDCHARVGHYNEQHKLGTKFKIEELKIRREQVYEEFTRHLVPPVECQVTKKIPGGGERKFPEVGFILRHHGNSLPVKVRVVVKSIFPEKEVAVNSDLYSGKKLWNLNPLFGYSAHFKVDQYLIPKEGLLELRVRLSIIDQYEREHDYLPIGFVYNSKGDYWYAEP